MKDQLDWKILEALQENSRNSYAQIGREVGLSASAVAERVQRLEDTGVIKGYTALLDNNKLLLPLAAYISVRLKNGNLKPFANSLEAFPEVVECSRITGNDCVIMRVLLRDTDHLEKLIDRLSKYGDASTSVVLSDILRNGKIVNK